MDECEIAEQEAVVWLRRFADQMAHDMTVPPFPANPNAFMVLLNMIGGLMCALDADEIDTLERAQSYPGVKFLMKTLATTVRTLKPFQEAP